MGAGGPSPRSLWGGAPSSQSVWDRSTLDRPSSRLSREDDGRSAARMTCGKQAERTICLVESRDNRELAPTTGVEGGTGATKPGVWQSVTTIPWAWLSAGLLASALFAGGVALF